MSLSTFLLIKTITCLLLGVPFVLSPATLMAAYGDELSPIATMLIPDQAAL